MKINLILPKISSGQYLHVQMDINFLFYCNVGVYEHPHRIFSFWKQLNTINRYKVVKHTSIIFGYNTIPWKMREIKRAFFKFFNSLKTTMHLYVFKQINIFSRVKYIVRWQLRFSMSVYSPDGKKANRTLRWKIVLCTYYSIYINSVSRLLDKIHCKVKWKQFDLFLISNQTVSWQ